MAAVGDVVVAEAIYCNASPWWCSRMPCWHHQEVTQLAAGSWQLLQYMLQCRGVVS
jgi:hypothetical protein